MCTCTLVAHADKLPLDYMQDVAGCTRDVYVTVVVVSNVHCVCNILYTRGQWQHMQGKWQHMQGK